VRAARRPSGARPDAHLGYLEALLAAEADEGERHANVRRLKEAHLPRVKILDEFEFGEPSKVSATQIPELAEVGASC
jgi:hypothetical protein